MPVAWSPRMATIKENAAAGAGSIKLLESALDGAGSFMARVGSQIVTLSEAGGGNWGVSPGLVEPANAGGFISEVTLRVLVNGVEHTGVAKKLRHREQWPEGEIEATWEIDTRTPGTYTPNMDGLPVPFTLYSNELGGWVPFFGGYMGRVSDRQNRNGLHHLALT